jgi:hypothetical protein
VVSFIANAEEAATPQPSASPSASAAPTPQKWVAHVLRDHDTEKHLAGLDFPAKQFPVTLVQRASGLRPLVEVSGRYTRHGWSLYAPDGTLLAIKNDRFHFFAYLNGRISEAFLTAKGPKGETQSERVYLFAPEAQEFKVVTPWNAVLVSLGLGGFSFYQTDYGTFHSAPVIFKVEYNDQGDDRIALNGLATGSLFTVWSSPSQQGPQFLQMKADVAWRIQKDPLAQWGTQLMGGLSYRTIFSNGSPFGFSNLFAYDLGVRTRYVLSVKRALIGEIHYTPVGKSLGLKQYGIDLSFKFSKILENAHRLQISLDYTILKFDPDSATSIDTRLLAINFGYSL